MVSGILSSVGFWARVDPTHKNLCENQKVGRELQPFLCSKVLCGARCICSLCFLSLIHWHNELTRGSIHDVRPAQLLPISFSASESLARCVQQYADRYQFIQQVNCIVKAGGGVRSMWVATDRAYSSLLSWVPVCPSPLFHVLFPF